jgi:hypothetical protein
MSGDLSLPSPTLRYPATARDDTRRPATAARPIAQPFAPSHQRSVPQISIGIFPPFSRFFPRMVCALVDYSLYTSHAPFLVYSPLSLKGNPQGYLFGFPLQVSFSPLLYFVSDPNILWISSSDRA